MSKRLSQSFDTASLKARYTTDRTMAEVKSQVNAAPGERLAAIVENSNGTRILTSFRWGLLPFWTRELNEETHRYRTARAETLATKPAFAWSFRERRCIIPISAFFEWFQRDELSGLLRFAPTAADETWSVAGVWDEWITRNGAPLRTVAIVTTEANDTVEPASARMPSILRRCDEDAWLDGKNHNTSALLRLLAPMPSKAMEVQASDAELLTRLYGVHEASQITNTDAPRQRLVRRDWVSPDGQVFFKTRSFTRRDYAHWHPVVDTHDGRVWCDCPDFRFRHAPHDPNLTMPEHWCKHLVRAVDNCRKHGDLFHAETPREMQHAQ